MPKCYKDGPRERVSAMLSIESTTSPVNDIVYEHETVRGFEVNPDDPPCKDWAGRNGDGDSWPQEKCIPSYAKCGNCFHCK